MYWCDIEEQLVDEGVDVEDLYFEDLATKKTFADIVFMEVERKRRVRKAIGEYVDVMVKGGVASGNHGHRGRPGHIGGSGPGGGQAVHRDGKWQDGEGGALPDHILACKIPPAWTNVEYNKDPNGDMLVCGQDSKGRTVHIYSERFMKQQSDAKFARVMELDAKFDRIMSDVQKDITTGKSLEEASALRLIMTTGIRPGSDTDTQAKVKAYGATTLHGSHVVQEGGGVRLKFTGKKGVNLDIPVTDATVAKDLLARKKNAGDSGRLFQTDSSKLLDYTHSQDGGKFKTKDFRTLMGTRTAVVEMANLGWHPLTKTDYVKAVKTVARKVAEKLGNTPVVALQSYIHPGVFGIWRINSGANA